MFKRDCGTILSSSYSVAYKVRHFVIYCAMKCLLSLKRSKAMRWINLELEPPKLWAKNPCFSLYVDTGYFFIVFLSWLVRSLIWVPRSEGFAYLLPTSLLVCLLMALAHRILCLCPLLTLFTECSFSIWVPVVSTHLYQVIALPCHMCLLRSLFSISWSTSDILTFYIFF